MTQTILVVEDDELNQALFSDLLTTEGYRAVVTGEPLAALALAREHRPDLVLMDIQLPAISGLEVTRWLKDDPALASIPVIAVTAYAMQGDEARMREGGCAAYIPKPIRVADFLATIRGVLPPI